MTSRVLLFLALLAAGAASVIAVQHQKTARLSHDVQALQARSATAKTLKREQSRLLALQVSSEELAQLRHDHADIAEIQRALVNLGSRTLLEELSSRSQSSRALPPWSPLSVPAGTELAQTSRDQDSSSPQTVLEQIIGAVNSANVETLTALIAFDTTGKAEARNFFLQLPASVREEYGTEEKLYATLMAAYLPLGLTGVTIVEDRISGEYRVLKVKLERQTGAPHETTFTFLPSSSGWRMIVPDKMVRSYRRALTGPSASVPLSAP